MTAQDEPAGPAQQWQENYDILLDFCNSYLLTGYDNHYGWATFLAYLQRPLNPNDAYGKEYMRKGQQPRDFIFNGENDFRKGGFHNLVIFTEVGKDSSN